MYQSNKNLNINVEIFKMKVNSSLPLQRVMDTAEKIGSFLIVEDLDSSDGEDSDDEGIEFMLLLLL